MTVPYHSEHEYYPDFTIATPEGFIQVEVKGYFQDRAEMSKYNWVKKALADNEELVFIFERPDKPIHFQAKRKDGTKMTHREWCTKQGFRCFSEADAGELVNDN